MPTMSRGSDEDEEAAAAREAAEEQRMQEEDSARRLAVLRGEEPPPLSSRLHATIRMRAGEMVGGAGWRPVGRKGANGSGLARMIPTLRFAWRGSGPRRVSGRHKSSPVEGFCKGRVQSRRETMRR